MSAEELMTQASLELYPFITRAFVNGLEYALQVDNDVAVLEFKKDGKWINILTIYDKRDFEKVKREINNKIATL